MIDDVRYKLIIGLKNGIQLSIDNSNLTDNYISKMDLNESISAETNLPVGVNTSNVLDIEIVTKDRSLIPTNESSPYFGFMNSTSYIDVLLYVNGVETPFGRYYVTSWRSSISDETPNTIKISATCIIGVLSKMEVPDVMISNHTDIKHYLVAVLSELKNKLSDSHILNIDPTKINFDAFPLMQFSNLDTNNMSNLLNGLTVSTLTNIFADRAGNIMTDYSCDDTPSNSKANISVMYGAEAGDSDLIDYDGVAVNYSLGSILDVELLSSLHEQQVTPGTNTFADIKLGEAVYKVNQVKIVTADPNTSRAVHISEIKYNKNSLSLKVESSTTTKISVYVYGQRLDTSALVYSIEGSNKLEINNKVLKSELIPKFADNINKLIKLKNNSLTIQGFFPTSLQLCDVVFVDCSEAMNVSGFYKISSLTWSFDLSTSATIKLVKTFEFQYDTDKTMNSLNNSLELTLNAKYPTSDKFTDLSESENSHMNVELSTELNQLRALQYREA